MSTILFWVVPILIATRFHPVVKSSSNVSIHLLRERTYSLEISFGRRSTGQNEFCAISLLALTILVHIRPNIRMVDTLRVGRVFVAGGQFSNLFYFIGDHLMLLV